MVGLQSNRFINLSEREETLLSCGICYNIYENPIKSECGHTFCKTCLQECIETKKKSCPICRREFQSRKRTAQTRDDPNVIFIGKYVFKRDLMANDFIDKFETKCDFEFNGCQEVVEFGSLSAHKKECVHRFCSKCGFTFGKVEDHNCVELLINDRNRLKQELNQSLIQISEHKEVVKSKEVLINDFKHKISKLESKREKTVAKEKTREKELNDFELKYKSILKTNKKLEKRLLKRKQIVKSCEDLTQRKESELKSVSSQLKTRENETKDLKTKYESVLETNKQLKNDLTKEVNTSKQLKDRLSKQKQLIKDYEDLTQKYSELESEVKHISDQQMKHKKESNELETKYNKLLETNKQLNNDLNDELNISKHLKEQLLKHQQLVENCKDLTQNNSKLDSQLKSIASQLKTNEKETEDLKSKYERLLETNKQLNNDLNEEINISKHLEEQLSKEQQLVENCKDLKEKNSKLEIKLKSIASQLKDNENKFKDLKSNYESVLETNKQLENQRTKDVNTSKQLRADIKILNDKYSPLESKLDSLSKNTDYWREKYNNLFHINHELKNKLSEEEGMHTIFNQELNDKISKLQTDLETNEKISNEWKDKYEYLLDNNNYLKTYETNFGEDVNGVERRERIINYNHSTQLNY